MNTVLQAPFSIQYIVFYKSKYLICLPGVFLEAFFGNSPRHSLEKTKQNAHFWLYLKTNLKHNLSCVVAPLCC